MNGFRTIYTDEPLPTGGRVFIFQDGNPDNCALVVHEPSLYDDPRGVLDEITAHRRAFLHTLVLRTAAAAVAPLTALSAWVAHFGDQAQGLVL